MIQQKNRYWLNNAHKYLKNFQKQKLFQHNISRDTLNEKQKTFDQCEIPSSKESPEKFNKLKIKQQIQLDLNMKKKNIENVYVTSSILQHPQSDRLEEKIEEIQKNQKIELSDLIVREHLTKTLKIYQEDLAQLQQNRDNLVEAIEELTTKIQNLSELQSKNQILQLQNFKNKRQILTLMRQYHDLKLNTTRKKLKINEDLLRKKSRIKTLIQMYPQQTEFVVQTESFNLYQFQLKQNKKYSLESPPQNKVLQQIFPKIEEQPQKSKIKQKQKSKIVDKAGLLGDLKSFAKNFKMPNSNTNDV